MAAELPFSRYINGAIKRQILPGIQVDDKTYGHVLINSRDVPKDANVGTSLNKEHSNFLKDIIGRLYYLTPPSGVASPGTVGKDHVIEEAFKNHPVYKRNLENTIEIPHSSAHGSRIHIDLGLRYIFRDAGHSVDKYLGPEAGSLAYSSPTNLIDSANVNTKIMREDFFNDYIRVIASEQTLKRFGFRLTKEITMYKLSLLEERQVVLKDVSANLIPSITTKLATAEFCITFDINDLSGVGIPFGTRIIMLFKEDHSQIRIPEYFTSDGGIFSPHNIFNAGNEVKNKQLSKIFEELKILGSNQVKKEQLEFLKHFIIEVKLLGDVNHCMFSRELIDIRPAPPAGGGSAAGGGGSSSSSSSLFPLFPQLTPVQDEGRLTEHNLAFGTNDYDVTLRFILEGINVFYHKGVCTKYYTSARLSSLERLIYVNQDTLTLIRQFRADLNKDISKGFYTVIDGKQFKGSSLQHTHRMYSNMKWYIDELIRQYEGFLVRLRATNISGNEKRIILQCTFKSPVITDPQGNTALAWSLTRGFFDKSRFYSYIKGTYSQNDATGIGTYIQRCSVSLTEAGQLPANILDEIRGDIRGLRTNVKRMREGLDEFLSNLEKKARPAAGGTGAGGGGGAVGGAAGGGGGGGGSYRKQRGGGSFTDYSASDFYPGLIAYIVLTEYRDILKFGLAVYLCFGKFNEDLLKFFYITQDEVVLHDLLEILSSGKSLVELNTEIESVKLEVVPEGAGGGAVPAAQLGMEGGEEEAPAAAQGEGDGGAAAAAAAAEKKKTILQNQYYDKLVFLACKYALHAVMYFRVTYNTSFSQFNPMDLDSLVKIIVSLLNISEEYDTTLGEWNTAAESDTMEEEGEPQKTPFSIFQSLRKTGSLTDDLTDSLEKHLNNTKEEPDNLFLDESNSYNNINTYFNLKDPIEIARAAVAAAGNSLVQGGGAYLPIKNQIGNTFNILSLQHSKVSELLHIISYTENLLTQMRERRGNNIIDFIEEYCEIGKEDKAAEAAADAAVAAEEQAAAAAAAPQPAAAAAAAGMGEGEAVAAPQPAAAAAAAGMGEEADGGGGGGGRMGIKTKGGSGYPSIFNSPGSGRASQAPSTAPFGSSSRSSVSSGTPPYNEGSLSPREPPSVRRKYHDPRTAQEVAAALAAAGGGGGGGGPRRYDNRKTRKPRKQTNKTRKL